MALRHNRFDLPALEQSLQQFIANKIEDIFAVNQTEADIATLTVPFLKHMHQWAQQFMGPNPMVTQRSCCRACLLSFFLCSLSLPSLSHSLSLSLYLSLSLLLTRSLHLVFIIRYI